MSGSEFTSLDIFNGGNDVSEAFEGMKLNEDKENVHQWILNYLEDKEAIDEYSAISPLSIAKHVFGKKATKKTVNSYLYTMKGDGKVNKITEEHMKRPRWYLSG
uniref:Helix-turn-helix domain protein n=1 Tax=Pithovirus LCPAC406 TaxID=2506599 RepID=A0A481ZDU2_9VIRU|nr:MAG: helix-turn-helix domain protein [Pithovirus LCPAC406]